MKRSGDRIRWETEFPGQAGTSALGMFFRNPVDMRGKTDEVGSALPALVGVPGDSPLVHVGPVPDELRKDPFSGGSVPWCIQEAEKERSRNREQMIWKVAIAVSWLVTAVAVLRSTGML